VTHVVAQKDGTDKALAARMISRCVLVKPAWLVECFWSMSRRDVKPHLMGADNSTAPSSESDDDDDFAAAFEDEMMNS
jgi:RNA polymerase II subunit A-like phosphatase